MSSIDEKVGGVQHASPVDAAVEEKKAQALALRIAGHSYRSIARALGMGHSRTHEMVIEALREARIQNAERVAELRALENARLDDLWWKLYPKPPKPGQPVPSLSPDVARQLIRISQSRRQLNGLDLPRFVGGAGAGDDEAYAAAFNPDNLSTEDLLDLERIMLRARGQGAEAMGLDPDDEVFNPEPEPGEGEEIPILPPAPDAE